MVDETVSEVVSLSDPVSALAAVVAADTLVLSESLSPDTIVRIRDVLRLADSVLPGGTQTAVVTNSLYVGDITLVSFAETISDSTTLSEALQTLSEAAGTLKDKLVSTDGVVPNQVLNIILAIGLAAFDAALQGYGGILVDTLGVTDVSVSAHMAFSHLADIVSIAETTVPSLLLVELNRDTVTVGESANSAVSGSEVLADGLDMFALFSDGNEAYASYVMNSRNFGVTTYDGYNFNSYAKLGSTILAAANSGLYSISGNDDDGSVIDWAVGTGKLDVGSGAHSRIEKVYMSGVVDSKVILKVTDGSETERWYESKTPRAGSDTVRFTTGRGVRARYWQFDLVGSGDMLLEQLELYPIVLTRR